MSTAEHVPQVQHDTTYGWRAVCLGCAWTGQWRGNNWRDADDDGDVHATEHDEQGSLW